MFRVELHHPFAETDRRDEDFECETAEKAALHMEDLIGLDYELALEELASGEALTYTEEDRVLTVTGVGA